MKIGICDDSNIYLKYLDQAVCRIVANKKDIIVEIINPEELSNYIQNDSCPYDILITDIDMGSFNGITFAKEINRINHACIIIFISSFLNFATDVYDAEHVYFVLKAEAEDRLSKALEKAFAVYYKRIKNKLTFHYQNSEYRIALSDITYIEALGRYMYIHDRTQVYKCIHSLKAITSELTDTFIRCHNSYIVNADYILSISRTSCHITTGETIPVSQTYSKSFQAEYVAYVSNKMI